MASLTTGRPLDGTGTPTDGPALELDPDGPAAELLADAPHALASSPGLGMWTALLDPLSETAVPELLLFLAPDANALPAHRHAVGSERFRAVEGDLTVVEDGDAHRLAPGETHTVEPGRDHYFRNDTDAVVAARVELPWRKTAETQYTVFGLDHEGAFGGDGEYGEPGLLQGLVMSEYLYDGTVISEGPPPLVQRALWATVGRLARARGYEPVEERFLDDAFWERTVEQPAL